MVDRIQAGALIIQLLTLWAKFRREVIKRFRPLVGIQPVMTYVGSVVEREEIEELKQSIGWVVSNPRGLTGTPIFFVVVSRVWY